MSFLFWWGKSPPHLFAETLENKELQLTHKFCEHKNRAENAWQYITSLADVVIHRYYRTYDVEDLVSLVVVDAAEFLLRVEQNMDSGAMVPRSIRNVLFTRMRNVASNYLYKLRRLVPVSSMEADGDSEAEQAKAEPSFWPCYAIDALPHRLWESAGAEGGGVVSLMPWADLERVVAANF